MSDDGSKKTMEQLLQQLNHNDKTVRYDAAYQLGKAGDARAAAHLVVALSDENSKVQYAALSSLVKIGSTDAALPTMQALLNAVDSHLWTMLTLDIGMRLRNGLFNMVERGNTLLADALLEALERSDLNEHQRALVVRLLGRTGDTRRVETFIDMLMLGSDTLQGAAAEALGYIGDARAVPVLMELIDEADSALREIFINALGRIGDTRAADALLPMLDSFDEWTRRAAATALAELGDKRAVRKLLRIQREDESQIVREAAGQALTRLIMDKDTPQDAD